VEVDFNLSLRERGGYPHPGWFFAKSAEAHENKRVEFLAGAKKCKRVRKSLKIKGIDQNALPGWKV
jgi:hypothetical protein